MIMTPPAITAGTSCVTPAGTSNELDVQNEWEEKTERRDFQHAHFIPIVGVGKGGEYLLVHGDLPGQHSFGTTLRFTGPAPADSRQ